MKTTNTLLAMAILASSSTAFAGTGATFESLDVDGNGSISKEEASADAEVMAKFDELDIDGNGELSPEEFANIE
ncbi:MULTISPECIES: EF-hand domain-containing protein [unclassified Pseudoalteromonas]|uniref:EF-hand domain-containing protein n=1 Tax=unclassified Pseudoalteromonas TaxID=194690 RepID=UPI000CF68A3F|nr:MULTISPECIES: EF-hand domain-containing protein [unclassified Pseudoalteromonas]MBS3796981.1 EF-hand domain-containing protein [Pseudoalteromonas sp. BDTF-M6]